MFNLFDCRERGAKPDSCVIVIHAELTHVYPVSLHVA
jgi:hypothetical protein